MATPEDAGEERGKGSVELGPILKAAKRLPEGRLKRGVAKAAVTTELVKGSLTMEAPEESEPEPVEIIEDGAGKPQNPPGRTGGGSVYPTLDGVPTRVTSGMPMADMVRMAQQNGVGVEAVIRAAGQAPIRGQSGAKAYAIPAREIPLESSPPPKDGIGYAEPPREIGPGIPPNHPGMQPGGPSLPTDPVDGTEPRF